MSFKDASKVLSTIEYGNQVEWVRSNNRRKINDGFNGVPPLTAEDAKKMGLGNNFNSGEMAVLGQHAKRQYFNAFQKPQNYFKVKLPMAPVERRMDWESGITRLVNKPLKDSLEYTELLRGKFTSVICHGIGPQLWLDREDWLPLPVALSDLRVPTDTRCSLDNLVWFAMKRRYTIAELSGKALGPDADKGWQKDVVTAVLKEYTRGDSTFDVQGTDYWDNPEKMAELLKQNGGYYMSDASPSIPMWHFFFKNDKKKWFQRVVAARDCKGAPAEKFVFDDGEEVFANSLREILHVQFGDLSFNTPALWHEVRSLGFLLREPCFWMDIFRCRMLSHCMENMNIGFRVANPSERGRVQKLELMNKFILDSSVQIIPNTERHQVDANLIETTMAQLKQLQSEASTSFTQNLETGSNKEMTATETMARVSQVNALMSGLLLTAVTYEKFAYQEICRRFCLKGSENRDAREFQEECKKLGIPEVYLNVKYWEIIPEVPLGAGNPTMEMAQAQALMQVKGAHSPDAQQMIQHMYDEAVTGDAMIAEALAPINTKPPVSNAAAAAGFAFGPLMMGVVPPMPEHLNPQEQVETLLQMMAAVVVPILQTDGMATEEQILGLNTVAEYVSGLIQRIAQDEAAIPQAKQYSQQLSEIMNHVKAFEQRLQQQRMAQQEEEGGANGEAQAKILDAGIVASTKGRINEASAAKKLEHKDIAFAEEQKRKNLQTIAEIERQKLKAESEAAIKANSQETAVQ